MIEDSCFAARKESLIFAIRYDAVLRCVALLPHSLNLCPNKHKMQGGTSQLTSHCIAFLRRNYEQLPIYILHVANTVFADSFWPAFTLRALPVVELQFLYSRSKLGIRCLFVDQSGNLAHFRSCSFCLCDVSCRHQLYDENGVRIGS